MKKFFYINNLHCSHCALKIETTLKNLDFIDEVIVDITNKKLYVNCNKEYTNNELIQILEPLITPIEEGIFLSAEKNDKKIENNSTLDRNKTKILIVGIVILVITFFLEKGLLTNLFLIFAYILVGYDIVWLSLKNIIKGKVLDENFLMTIATFGAFALGDFSEAVAVMVFYKTGEYFQEIALNRSKKEISSLVNLKVITANLKSFDGTIIEVEPESLRVNEIIVIKNGEKVPTDGIVISGDTIIDSSALTGESLPLNISVGDSILSGSINIGKVIEVKVTKKYVDSTINKIIEMVENAALKKPKAEKFITKFAAVYTPIVVVIALFIGLILPIFIGDFTIWFGRGLVFLVISCPCALVLSIPLTFFSTIGYSSKKGILIKGGNYLEKLNSIDTVIFDKTGTLTYGKFSIDEIQNINIEKEEFLQIIKAGEFYSNHPIAKAILSELKVTILESDISDYIEIPGKGISTKYLGNQILLGNEQLMKENNIVFSPNESSKIPLYISKNSVFIGTILLSDKIKENAKQTILELKKLGITSYMLTGDKANVANIVAETIGIENNNVFSSLLPQQKLEKLELIKINSKGVIFVGDGLNDGPVLATADIGVAMGGIGSDLAIEAGDIVIVDDDIEKIIQAITIGKFNRKVLIENIVFALGIKILVMIFGVLGIVNLWLAIFADVGVSLLAVLNASKILRKK
jgi:Cd2+/Zn2+-exporting ATPase